MPSLLNTLTFNQPTDCKSTYMPLPFKILFIVFMILLQTVGYAMDLHYPSQATTSQLVSSFSAAHITTPNTGTAVFTHSKTNPLSGSILNNATLSSANWTHHSHLVSIGDHSDQPTSNSADDTSHSEEGATASYDHHCCAACHVIYFICAKSQNFVILNLPSERIVTATRDAIFVKSTPPYRPPMARQ